ncbi:sure-like protein [Rhizodiscina lignyota]|uniref:Sure-like protein n=1 Tax=Rhizodiscina lignyota TaxID=1504668 RepID=A0A9P4M7R0_9PEZI|nr:sure-like protein [Rhizodiscina lignyota]
MRTSLILACSAVTAHAANIVMSNDDGWAEINIRTFYQAIIAAGNSAFISAPAENKSGSGSLDATPEKLDEPCEFNSCPTGSPATGNNASMPQFNYVNSYPVTSIKYGIQTLASTLLPGPIDIAVTGPNVGSNLGLTTQLSGTVGAATEAAKEGIPAIAFSGSSGDATAWNVPAPSYALVYADLATNVTDTLLASGSPYLPKNVWLNVNFPDSDASTCSSASDFKFVLSRINTAVPIISGDDVSTCGNNKRLPTESDVVGTARCYASISVGHADTKLTASASEQSVVLQKLSSILSCLPS